MHSLRKFILPSCNTLRTGRPGDESVFVFDILEGASLRAVARALQRSPSSISREVARHRDPDGMYTASMAGERARARTH